MVYRIYVEKKDGLAGEADALLAEINNILSIRSLTGLRLFNRYDVENIDRDLFDYAVKNVFSEPQLDNVSEELPEENAYVFAVEYLPGQFDQRADSAAQCIQIISQKDRPLVRTAKVYMLYGNLTVAEIMAIKKHVINPVEAREASLDTVDTLKIDYAVPTQVKTLDGFLELDKAGLENFVKEYALAMDADDIKFC